MNQYNEQFGAKDLFMNPDFAHIFPQFQKDEPLRNVYSFADTERRVRDYLVAALNGKISSSGGIVVKGQHQSIMNRVKSLQPLIEAMINNMPKVVSAVRKNTSLYLPYATKQEIEGIKTSAQKQRALKMVLDNFQYNDKFNALNSIKNEQPDQFRRNKNAWETKVGIREKKIRTRNLKKV